jgi:putative restriction endonuclease
MILAAYDRRCCVTGLANVELLVASHIVPWALNKDARVNPRNGLCLNALHDRAFDRGLMTITKDHRVKLAPALKTVTVASTTQRWLAEFDDCPIRLPQRFQPDEQFLDWHRRHCFRAS